MGIKYEDNSLILSKNYIKNLNWFIENRNRLSKYEGNWILIYSSEVVTFSPNPNDISRYIEDKGINVNDCIIHFLVNANCIF